MLKYTKVDYGWGSTQTPLGSLTHHHKPLHLRDHTSKGRKDGREGQRNWRGERRVEEEDF